MSDTMEYVSDTESGPKCPQCDEGIRVTNPKTGKSFPMCKSCDEARPVCSVEGCKKKVFVDSKTGEANSTCSGCYRKGTFKKFPKQSQEETQAYVTLVINAAKRCSDKAKLAKALAALTN